MKPHITITSDELTNPAIDDIINLEKSLSIQSSDEIETVKTPFYLNPVFYYSVSAAAASAIAWAAREPYFSDSDTSHSIFTSYSLFGSIAGAVGLALGAVYGLSNRNLKQLGFCGIVGLGVGMLATVPTLFIGQIIFQLATTAAVEMRGAAEFVEGEYPFTGVSFFILISGRGMAWAFVSMGAGLGLGVALKSKKLLFNGTVGGMIGGMLGGMLFDPVHRFIQDAPEEAALSRAVGCTCVGLLVGLFTGIIENLSKESWFLMQKGPLTGKQFILFKNATVIGSSPKADIYLFKDPAIEPKHAVVTKSGNKYLIADEKTGSGVFVNGRPIDKYILQPNDIVSIGETVLKYMEKEGS